MKCSICGWDEESVKEDGQVCAECKELMEEDRKRINQSCLHVGMTQEEIMELDAEINRDFSETELELAVA
jgi:predicted nucleic acid-binding Zn ribbon protein